MFIGQRPRSMSFQVHVNCKCHFRCIGVEFVQTWKCVEPGPLEYTTDDTVEEALGTEHQDAAQHKDVCKHMISFTLLGDHLNYLNGIPNRNQQERNQLHAVQSIHNNLSHFKHAPVILCGKMIHCNVLEGNSWPSLDIFGPFAIC